MKKILFLFAALLVACGDVDIQEEDLKEEAIPVLNIDNALTISGIHDSIPVGETVTVVGYMIGYVKSTNLKSATFDLPPDKANTNVLLADADTVRTGVNCFPVALEKGALRDSLNFYENPQLLGRKMALKGKVESYFGTKGVKKILQMRWVDEVSEQNQQNIQP